MAAESEFTGRLHDRRFIGIAMGMLMDRHAFTDIEAFDVLFEASIGSGRPLADVARSYVEGRIDPRNDSTNQSNVSIENLLGY